MVKLKPAIYNAMEILRMGRGDLDCLFYGY